MNDKVDFLRDAASRAPGQEVKISIRELLRRWDAKRRGYWIVAQIERDLEKANLTTAPPFTEGWIDSVVTLVRVKQEERKGMEAPATSDLLEATDASLPEVSLRVGSLSAANCRVISVLPQDSLDKAQSIMMRYDFSQLAVMSSSRDLRGAVTWESIAEARIRNPQAALKEAVEPAEVVRSGDDLLEKIPRVVDAGFVFVQGPDRQISGIVTTADLSNQFATLAKPFFMLAEIERRLRRIIDGAFTSEELREFVDPSDTSRQVKSAADLTIGEYVRLLERPDCWMRLRWALDRKEFIEAMQEVRGTRNEVMHFSPDPLDDDQIVQLGNFLKWLRKLDPES
jgi:restriction system protein